MPKKKTKSKGLLWKIIKGFFKYVIWYPIKYIFYGIYLLLKYLIKGIIHLFKKTKETHEKLKIDRKRSSTKNNYVEMSVLNTEKGDYDEFEKKVTEHESLIGIILGARGTGKTAIALRLLENIHSKTKRRCFAIGFNEKDMPSWINVVEKTEDVENGGFVLVDEGGILFSSRSSMATPNKLLSNLMLIARHKNISILFISQNSSNLDVNILRQADYLIMKPSSLLQEKFERKIIGEIYQEVKDNFEKYKKNKGATYIYSDMFRGFISNPLPSFWETKISKSFSRK